MVAGLSFWLLVYELVSILVDPNHNIKLFGPHVYAKTSSLTSFRRITFETLPSIHCSGTQKCTFDKFTVYQWP